MNRTALLMSFRSIVILFLVVSVEPIGMAQNQVQPQAQPQWLSVTEVSLYPDMYAEWLDFQKNEVMPALQKGGIKWRRAWQKITFGEALEYVFVLPIESLAQFDLVKLVEKGLGPEGARAYFAKARRLTASTHTHVARTRPDLSYESEKTWPPKFAVVATADLAPGHYLEFESMVKNEILPVIAQTGIPGYRVVETFFGGNAYQYVTLVHFDSFADIGKGSPLVRVLGEGGFNKLLHQKVAGVIVRFDRTVARYDPELSFPSSIQAQAK